MSYQPITGFSTMNAANAVKCAEDKYEDAFGTRSNYLIAELMSYYVVSSTYNANTQTFHHIIQPSGTGPKEVLYVGEMGMDNDPRSQDGRVPRDVKQSWGIRFPNLLDIRGSSYS